MEKLNIEQLKEMSPGIFKSGTYTDAQGTENRWVAVRGGYHDWCIYQDMMHKAETLIASHGNKIHDMVVVAKLIDCEDDALEMYRH